MLTPEQIELRQIQASRITSNMQKNIMEKIVKGIRKSGEITNSTDYLIYRAHELGATKEYIRQQIQEQLELSDEEIREMFEDAGKKAYVYDKKIYEMSNTPFVDFEDNEDIRFLVDRIIERTQNEMRNITQTLGFAQIVNGKAQFSEIGKFYVDTMDTVFYGVLNGTSTVDEGVRKAVSVMSNSGIRTIDYESGHMNRVDVAVRRNIMTSLTQMQEEITNYNAEKLDTTIFEFSWHTGARPSHGWGGQRYDTNGIEYPTKEDVYNMYGRGTMDDYNCRHSVYPTFKEFPPAYSKEELKRLNAQEQVKKEWEGKEYNKYEQTQMMRKMETKMRQIRSDINLLKTDPDGDKEVLQNKRIKYRALMDEYSRFCGKMGLATQKNRIYQDMLGRV